MKERRELYSETGYCALFTADKRLIWSDNLRLFRRISKLPSFKKLQPDPDTGAVGDLYMSFENVRHHIVTYPVSDTMYLCRAYPQYGHMLEDFQEEFNDIRYEALHLFAFAGVLKDMKRKGRYRGIEDYISAIMNCSENIYIDMVMLNQRIEGPIQPLFVPVRKFFLNLSYKLEWYSSQIKIRIPFVIDIAYPVAKIDYNVIEVGIYSLARIVYKMLDRGDTAVLYIVSDDSDKICISLDIPLKHNDYLETDDFTADRNAISVVFERLEAAPEITEEGGRFVFKAYIPAKFTDDLRYVKPSKFNKPYNDDLLMNFDPASRVCRDFYALREYEPGYFHSEIKEFEDLGIDDYGSHILNGLVYRYTSLDEAEKEKAEERESPDAI